MVAVLKLIYFSTLVTKYLISILKDAKCILRLYISGNCVAQVMHTYFKYINEKNCFCISSLLSRRYLLVTFYISAWKARQQKPLVLPISAFCLLVIFSYNLAFSKMHYLGSFSHIFKKHFVYMNIAVSVCFCIFREQINFMSLNGKLVC